MKKLFSIFAALTLSVGLWADGSVITYTATAKLETQFQKFEDVVSHDFSGDRGIVTLSGTLTRIPYSAFIACKDLRSIELPESVTMIDETAFNGCSLESITLPASVGTIGVNAFAYCSSLQSVTFLGNACQNTIGEDAFIEVGKNTPATLTLPANWTGGKPGVDGSWYGGKFIISAPTPVSTTYIDENGVEQNIDAFEVKDASEAVTWGTAGQTTWFVVNGANVQLSKGAVCAGDVRLILADNAQLTALGASSFPTGYAGIQVSGEGNSLTIYGQSTGDEMGQLIAYGGYYSAGIGGGNGGNGSNITINGGKVTANGEESAAGIGGGMNGSGSNITINGGTVTATGESGVAGIGSGKSATVAASNIYISDAYILKAGAEADPTAVIEHSSATDLASTLTQRYVQFGGLATPYTRIVTANQWGTVCLPYAVTGFSGVTFYKVNYYNAGENALYLEEVTALEAGKPYIFEAEEDGTLTINHSATAPMAYSEAGNEGGLYGSFARTDIESDGDMAALSGGKIVVVDNEGTVTVPACRAYLDMSEVATSQQGNAPLRKFGAPRGTATGEMRIENGEMRMNGKFIINGRLVIVKDGKKINALGL